MGFPQAIFFIDVSAVIFMIVLAYLSSRLGEALKIPPFYKVLYGTAALVIAASVLDVIAGILPVPASMTISMMVRFAAGCLACLVVLRYWFWVFSEFFKH
jgi:hypothetical protein